MNSTKIDTLVEAHYKWLDDEALAAPKILINDVLRFRGNRLVRWLQDSASEGRRCNLNDLWSFALAANVPRQEMKEFYRLIGYSCSGYGDINFQQLSEGEENA